MAGTIEIDAVSTPPTKHKNRRNLGAAQQRKDEKEKTEDTKRSRRGSSTKTTSLSVVKSIGTQLYIHRETNRERQTDRQRDRAR